VLFERTNEIIVDEIVKDDEFVNDANRIFLKKRPMEDVEGNEFTLNFSSKEKFRCTPNSLKGSNVSPSRK
jgi:hypothetical protein